MQQHIKINVSSYLTDTYIDSLDKFQQIVRNFSNQIDKISKNMNCSVYLDSNKSLKMKKPSSLALGANKNIAVQMIVLRVLWNKFNTFILTAQKLSITDINQIFCLIIDTPDFNAPFNQSWKNDLGSMAILFVKQPFVDDNIINDLKIIKTVIENVELKEKPRYKGDINKIKTAGNEFYNKGDYINAFYYYQCALSCCFQFSDSNTRSILYNNSAASLFKLNLFDSSLKYCQITLKIDRNYYKSYFWKIQCLLQKKQFGQIPNLLILLQPKATNQEFLKLNTKYSIYLSNSLGMYNWHNISQIRRPKLEVSVCDYASKSIGMRVQDDRLVYYAIDKIAKHQILIISKPMIFAKKPDNNCQTLCDSIIKCFNFQRSISNNLKDLLSPFPKDYKQNKQIQIKQIQKNIKKYLMKPKDITVYQTDSIGLWPDLIKFSHSCQPNCSFAHFQSVMLISASTNIKKGQYFTLDFASTISQRNRKQFLLRKFNIFCKCPICQLQNWPDTKLTSSIQELANITDSNQNINMIKHVYWELIVAWDLSCIDYALIQKSHSIMIEEVNWTDLIIAIQMLRKGHQKLQKPLLQILVSGFKSLLKIPSQVALKVIKNLT